MKKIIKLTVMLLIAITANNAASSQGIIKDYKGYATIWAGTNFFTDSVALVYNVEQGGKEYNFSFAITKYGKSEVKLAYMSQGNKTNEGFITIDSNALENSNKLFNYFGNKDYTLTDATTLFLSKKLWKDVKELKNVKIDLGGMLGVHEFTSGKTGVGKMENTLDIHPITISNEYVDLKGYYELVSTTNPNYSISLFDIGTNNPLIIGMSLDFDISLTAAFGKHLKK